MKKLTFIWALGLLSFGALAQTDTSKTEDSEPRVADEIEIEIEGRSIVIDTEKMKKDNFVNLNEIIREVSRRTASIMAKREEMIAQINAQEEAGEISEEQAEEMRENVNERTEESMEQVAEIMEAWSEDYEERMEEWEERFEQHFEQWGDEVERRAEANENFEIPPMPPLPPLPPAAEPERDVRKRVVIDEDGVKVIEEIESEQARRRIEIERELRSKEDEDEDDEDCDNGPTQGYFDINFGFNQQMLNGEDLITEGNDELNFWKSTAFELGLGAKSRIGGPNSKLYIKYGGEFSWHNFRLNNDNMIFRTDDRIFFSDTSLYQNIDKSKYHIAYFNVPLMLQLDFSKAGERDEAFTLGAGGYAGVRINAKREVEYSNSNYRSVEEKAKSDFFTSQFRYGLMGQIGFNSFKITAKYDLNPFFEENRGPDYQMASITIGWTL